MDTCASFLVLLYVFKVGYKSGAYMLNGCEYQGWAAWKQLRQCLISKAWKSSSAAS